MQQYKFYFNSSFILCYRLNLGLEQGVIQKAVSTDMFIEKGTIIIIIISFLYLQKQSPIVNTFPCNSLYFSIRSDLLKRISLYKYVRPIVLFFLACFFHKSEKKKNTRKYRKNSICCCFYKKSYIATACYNFHAKIYVNLFCFF